MNKKTDLITELTLLLRKGNAHVSLTDALTGIPFSVVDKKPGNAPYSIWQLADHIRIAQWDILEFCRNPQHESPEWPEGYWSKKVKPTKSEWQNCLAQIDADREQMISLLKKNKVEKLFEVFSFGNGQSLFREALVLADHNSYHTGEIIVLRRLLGIWK